MHTQINDVERRIRSRVAELVGSQRFKVWFGNSTRFSMTDNFLKVGVPNLFISNWLENHFSEAISHAAKEVVGGDVQVSYSIDSTLCTQLRKGQLNSQAQYIHRSAEEPARARRPAAGDGQTARGAQRLRGRFEHLVVGPRNELAVNIARAVVQNPGQTYNPVFVHGGCGVGKTHLLHGMANAVADGPPGLRWRYCCGEEFTNEFLLALKYGKLESFRAAYRELDVLLIDDVHFLSNKRATQEEFLHTFNAINAVGRQIVLASDAHPKMIGQLSEALVSRFVAGIVVEIQPPDVATRCEILRRRAAALGRTIPEDVIAYVADRIDKNVRELEGALVKLIAYAQVARTPITVGLARQALEEHLTRTAPVLTVGDIEMRAAALFGLTPADLHSSCKTRTIALARNVAMYLARRHTRLSLPEVGRLMGNKNHTTVLHAERRIRAMLDNDSDANWQTGAGGQVAKLREIVSQLEQQIQRQSA